MGLGLESAAGIGGFVTLGPDCHLQPRHRGRGVTSTVGVS